MRHRIAWSRARPCGRHSEPAFRSFAMWFARYPGVLLSLFDGGQTCVTLNLVIHFCYTDEKG